MLATLSAAEATDWEPFDLDLEPIEGHPRFQVVSLCRNQDGVLDAGFAIAQPSKFRLAVNYTETFYQLEGRMTVEREDGTAVGVGPGESIHMSKGERLTWTFHDPIKSFYVLQEH